MDVELLPIGSSLPGSNASLEREAALALIAVPAGTVPGMIACQCKWRPDALAVVSGGISITYGDLNARADAVALRLRGAGLSSNEPVGVFFESSIDLIVAALGIWKAGGAYLPVDPAYPADRAAFILSDSRAPFLLTRRQLSAAVGGGAWQIIAVEDISAAQADQSLPEAFSLDHLAYVIYTSGSTGQPKGVEITHGNLLNLVEWHTREFAVTASDHASQIASPGFDAAVWELWPYLAAGATLHLPPPETRFSAALMRDWLVAEKITISFVPTVLAEQMLRLSWPAQTNLRVLLTGGDALHTFPADDLPFQLVNNYGPTECTVVATSAAVHTGNGEQPAPAIGRPILNTAIYLLDELGKQVTDGGAGEIYIAGRSVGKGYRNQPELTASKFVTIAIDGTPQRMFRTGDIARRAADGQLAFLGRADDQIKIRGFRIEPEEIAAVINRHASIVSSAVVARSDGQEKRLVAYVVAKPAVTLWERDLRELLTRQLPDYMVPASFVLLDRIPVTANGKLDKAALPAPNDKNQLRRDNYVAPRSEVEEIVEGVLSPILGLERVSIFDNFFLLGGHSLMGAQVIARVRDIFDVELSLRNVFECPTVAKLAGRIEATLTARLEAMSEEEVHQALRLQAASDLGPISTPKAG